jgi:bifunctional DNA-binding transcriptional regulator/antitoxin component of YhaV-PrlF toxin-antitoxin module
MVFKMTNKILRAVKKIDSKGRLVIPKQIREHESYLIYTEGKTIILEGAK